jgi:hypothetical protein
MLSSFRLAVALGPGSEEAFGVWLGGRVKGELEIWRKDEMLGMPAVLALEMPVGRPLLHLLLTIMKLSSSGSRRGRWGVGLGGATVGGVSNLDGLVR